MEFTMDKFEVTLDYAVCVLLIGIVFMVSQMGDYRYRLLVPLLLFQFILQVMFLNGPHAGMMFSTKLAYVSVLMFRYIYNHSPLETILCVTMFLGTAWLFLLGKDLYACVLLVLATQCLLTYVVHGASLKQHFGKVAIHVALSLPLLLIIYTISQVHWTRMIKGFGIKIEHENDYL